MLKNLKKL